MNNEMVSIEWLGFSVSLLYKTNVCLLYQTLFALTD